MRTLIIAIYLTAALLYASEKPRVNVGVFIFSDCIVIGNDIRRLSPLGFTKDENNKGLLLSDSIRKALPVLTYQEDVVLDKKGLIIEDTTIPSDVFIKNSILSVKKLNQQKFRLKTVLLVDVLEANLNYLIWGCDAKGADLRFVTIKYFDNALPISEDIVNLVSSKKRGDEYVDFLNINERDQAIKKYFNSNPDRSKLEKWLKRISDRNGIPYIKPN